MTGINILLVLIVISLVTYMIASSSDGSADIRKRLDEYSGSKMEESAVANPMEDEELNKSFFDRIIKPVIHKFANIMTKRSKVDTTAQLKKELAQAGNPGGLTAAEFKALKLLVMLLFPGLTFLLGLIAGVKPPIVILFSAVIFTVAFLVPRIYLQRRGNKRKKDIVRSLPDVLDLLTVSVEAGLGFDQAMSKVCEKFVGTLSDELNYVLQEMQMGKQRRDALKNCANKMEVDELSSFISALVQADSLGVSVANVLKVQSEQARERRKARAEELAMQAPVKMLFPMVGCIFPTIMVILLGGAAMQFIINMKVPGQK